MMLIINIVIIKTTTTIKIIKFTSIFILTLNKTQKTWVETNHNIHNVHP